MSGAITKRPKLARIKVLGRMLANALHKPPAANNEGTDGAVGVAPAQMLDAQPYRLMRRQAVKAVLYCGGGCALLLVPYAAPGVPPLWQFVSSGLMAGLSIYGLIRNQDIRSANLFLERQRAIYIAARDKAMEKSLEIQEGKIVGLPDPAVLPEDRHARELVEALFSLGFHVSWKEKLSGPAFERHRIVPARGVKVDGLLRLGINLQVYLGCDTPPLLSPKPGHIAIDIPLPKNERKTLLLESYIYPEQRQLTEPVTIAIGVDLAGQLVEVELSDPNTCHFLVGGTTGSGKSEFLRSLMLSLLARYSPAQLQIVLVDPKRVTFPEFESMPWLFQPVAKDDEAAIAVMEKLVQEMDSRYQQFERAGVPNIRTFNQEAEKRGWAKMPVFVCIFDEYADFMAEKKVRDALEASIKRLGAMARAAGIHLIIATQRPEGKVVTPLIRSNLPGRVALNVACEADSEIVLAIKDANANNLSGKGDLLLLLGGNKLERLQAPLATAEFIEQIVSRQWEPEPSDSLAVNPEILLPVHLEEIIRLSTEKGWLTARVCYQSSTKLQKYKMNEIRGFFQQLASSGKGQIHGRDDRLKWCLDPEKHPL